MTVKLNIEVPKVNNTDLYTVLRFVNGLEPRAALKRVFKLKRNRDGVLLGFLGRLQVFLDWCEERGLQGKWFRLDWDAYATRECVLVELRSHTTELEGLCEFLFKDCPFTRIEEEKEEEVEVPEEEEGFVGQPTPPPAPRRPPYNPSWTF